MRAAPYAVAVARFWSHTTPEPNTGCLLWLGSANALGYGLVAWEGKTQAAHRVAAKIAGNALLPRQNVCHRCDTPLCVNPDHLFIGSSSDNARDAFAKGRRRSPYSGVTHCKQGHEYTAANTIWRGPGKRHRTCRACSNKATLAWYHNNKAKEGR